MIQEEKLQTLVQDTLAEKPSATPLEGSPLAPEVTTPTISSVQSQSLPAVIQLLTRQRQEPEEQPTIPPEKQQVSVELPPISKVNCIQMHATKPQVGYGFDTGFAICNSTSGKRILSEKVEEDISRLMFLQSHEGVVTISNSQDQKQSTMRIWKCSLKNQESSEGNLAKLCAKCTLKFDVMGIKYNQEILGIISLSKIYFFCLKKLRIINIVDTIENKKGLLSMTLEISPAMAAIPGTLTGLFSILNMRNYEKSSPFRAHQSELTNLLITHNGVRVATTSVKARSVKIFSCASRELMQQIKLYDCKDQILSIRFSWETDWMAVCTKDGKLRVFASKLTKRESSAERIQLDNPQSMFRFLTPLFKYFEYQLPFSEFDLKQDVKGYLCTVKFQQDNHILVAYMESASQLANVVKLRFDHINGGSCKQEYKTPLE